MSRKQRKIQRQKLVNNLKRLGYTEKEIKQTPITDIEKISISNIPQKQSGSIKNAIKILTKREKDRERQRLRRQRLQSQRLEKIERIAKIIGVEPLELRKQPTAKFLDQINLDDLKNGKYRRVDFKEYIPLSDLEQKISQYDFDMDHKVPDGKQIYFGFKSLTGEVDIEHELEIFSRYGNEELIKFLLHIREITCTGDDRGVNSSGRAGLARCEIGTPQYINQLKRWLKNDRQKIKLKSAIGRKLGRRYVHTEITQFWQQIKEPNKPAYTQFSARKFLIISNAILWNIIEDSRQSTYRELYFVGVKVIPWLKDFLD